MDMAFAEINAVQYLSVRSIRDLGINQLELIVDEAAVNEVMRGRIPESSVPESARFLLEGAAPIQHLEGSKVFRLYWKLYVAYLVTEELVGSNGHYEDEVYEGKLLRIYSQSHFLQHIERDTGGHFKPLLHYKLISLNHLIDVVSAEPPQIEAIEPVSKPVVQ